MNNNVESVKNILQREILCDANEDKLLQEAYEKLEKILHDTSDEEKTVIESIYSFMKDEVQKRKLLSYCLGYVDPTVKANSTFQKEQFCNHSFLKQNELYMLHQFIKRHQSDISFGETVYKIMYKHNLTAPQVYKNVLLRRQDFSRVTDPRCKNVTRKMAWQIIIGLRCSMQEADEVLFSAGYIRRNCKMDLTMQYFIEHKNYDIEAIDAVLSELGLKTFTCE